MADRKKHGIWLTPDTKDAMDIVVMNLEKEWGFKPNNNQVIAHVLKSYTKFLMKHSIER